MACTARLRKSGGFPPHNLPISRLKENRVAAKVPRTSDRIETWKLSKERNRIPFAHKYLAKWQTGRVKESGFLHN